MKITVGMTIDRMNCINCVNVESLLSQTLNSEEFEVILVNYKNDYAANYYFNKLKLRYNNLKQILVSTTYKDNMKNEVLKNIESDYVLFIEENYCIKPNALEELLTLAEESKADIVVNQELLRHTQNHYQAKVIEDELLVNKEKILLYKTEIIKSNEFLFSKYQISQEANKKFYIDYLSNSYGVAKYNNSMLFEVTEVQGNITIDNKTEYLAMQGQMLTSLSTGVAMTVENKIQSISQHYLTILHGNVNSLLISDKEIDRVDKQIWLREFSLFTNRYLLDACMSYIPRTDLNLVRAIKDNDLDGIETHLENLKIKKKLIPNLKETNNNIISKQSKLGKSKEYDILENSFNSTEEKLKIIDARIATILSKKESNETNNNKNIN